MAKEKIVLVSLGQTFDTNEIRDRYYQEITDYLREQGFDISVENGDEYDKELTVRQLKDADGVIFSSNGPMSRDVMERLPKLKIIMRMGIGLNSVDLPAAVELGKIVCNNPGYCSEEIALHAVTMGLAALRNLRYFDVNLRKGKWLKGNGPLPTRPRNMTMGIYGLGTSGHIVAQIMSNGFGSRIIAYDPYASEERARAVNAELVSFDTLLKESDILFIHAPLTDETYHAFDAAAFQKMKNTAILVNVSRGPIVDNAALAEAMKNGEIAKAALDVFEKEPVAVDSPLLSLDHLITSPHSAYYGKEAVSDLNMQVGHIMAHAFNDKRLYRKHLANPEVMQHLPDYTLVDAPLD